MPEPAKKSFVIFTYFALILGTLLVFWQVRNFGFVNYDDSDYVYENQHVLNGLTEDGVIWAFTTNHSGNWHPLTWLSLMLDCQLFGTNPGWMHLMNLLLHLANTLLLFAILRKMTGALWPSAFVAAAFAIHPMHVESVAWIAERKDVLSTLFFLLTLAAYISYVRRPGLIRYALTLLLFALGLLAKPMLVTLPFVLLLLDYWPLERIGGPDFAQGATPGRQRTEDTSQKVSAVRLIAEKIPFIALSIVSSVITFLAQLSAVAHIDALALKDRIANVFLSYVRYIGKMFWPQNLAVLYPFDISKFPFWQIACCVLLVLVISVLVICFGHKQRYLPVGWFWFLGMLIPVIGFVQVGSQSLADRYTYISYTGLFIIIAWGLPELLSKWPYRKIALGIAAVMVLTAMGIYTYRQAGYWKDGPTLFTHAIEVTQNNYIVYNTLGNAYFRLGRYQDAEETYKQAIRIKPDYVDAHYNHIVYNNLGVTYDKLGRYQDAVETYKQAIRIKPDDAEAYSNLGLAYCNLGRYQDAIESLKQAIRIKPAYAEAYINFGVTYYKLGRYQDAVEAYKQAIRIKPDFAQTYYNLGVTYLVAGDKGAALEEYKILKTLDAEKANELFRLINK